MCLMILNDGSKFIDHLPPNLECLRLTVQFGYFFVMWDIVRATTEGLLRLKARRLKRVAAVRFEGSVGDDKRRE